MATYNSNYELAQEISARIGTEPIPFDSVHSLCLEIYRELGGAEEDFDSVYAILLATLPLIDTIADKVIDDNIITTAKTWSSSKINTSLSGKQDVINDLSNIRSGASLGATAVQPSALTDYATTSAMTSALATKQDVINDLSTIRSGAALGATALQSVPSEYVTDTELSTELADYATASAMTTGLAAKQDTINDLDSIRSGAALGATALQSVPSEYITESELSSELSDYATTSALTTGLASKQDTLTAGSNITISGNTISATDTTYTASDFDIKDLADSTGLRTTWSGKQNSLTAGTNITISGTTISATYEVASTAEIEALFS